MYIPGMHSVVDGNSFQICTVLIIFTAKKVHYTSFCRHVFLNLRVDNWTLSLRFPAMTVTVFLLKVPSKTCCHEHDEQNLHNSYLVQCSAALPPLRS